LGARYLIPHLVVDLYVEMVGEALTAYIVPVVVRGQLKRGWESDEGFRLIANQTSASLVGVFNGDNKCTAVGSTCTSVSLADRHEEPVCVQTLA
jgi:hypothetical protein